MTALHRECARYSKKLDDQSTPLLIAKGAKVNAVDELGRTPLIYTVLYPRISQMDRRLVEFNIDHLALNGCNSKALDVLQRSALDTQMENLDLTFDYRVLNRVMIAAKLVTLGVPIDMDYHIDHHLDWFENAILLFGHIALNFFYESGDFNIAILLLQKQRIQPLTLQRLAANVIRRSLYPNALLGVQTLSTPPGWRGCKQYILLEALRIQMCLKYSNDYAPLIEFS